MDNYAWTSNTSPLARDWHIYGFNHGEVEYQPSGSNNYLSPHTIENHGSSKKSRLDGGDFRHGPNGFGNGLWRMVGESSQLLPLSRNPRLGRQNCTGWMQNQRAILHDSSCNIHETGVGSDRIDMDHEGNLGRNFKHGFTGLSNIVDPGSRSAGFDMFHTGPTIHTSSSASRFSITRNGCAGILPITGATFMKDKIDSWSRATGLYSSGINLEDGTSTVDCCADGPNLKEEYNREMFANSSGYGMGSSMMIDFQNLEMQGYNRNSVPVMSSLVGPSLSQDCVNSGGNCGLDATFFIHSSLLPLSDGGRTIASTSGLLNNSGIRGSCKRKRSVAGSAGSLPFPVPPSSGRMENNFCGSFCAAGPRRLGASSPNYTSSLSSTDLFHHATVTPLSCDRHYPRSILNGKRTESFLECLRRNTGNTIPFIGTRMFSPRNINSRLYNFQPEQSSSQFHISFAQRMRRSLATSPFQSWFSLQDKQPVGTGAAGTGGSVSMRGGDIYLSSVFSHRNGNSFGGSIWGGGNLFSRDNIYNGAVGTPREMASGLYESSQIRNMPIGVPCWPGATAAGSRMSVFDSVGHFTSAVTNGAGSSHESLSQLSQVGSIPMLHSGSASLRLAPHISACLSTRQSTETSQGHMGYPFTSSTASNNVVLGSLSSSLPASMHRSLYPSSMQRPVFVNDHGEGILVAPVHNLFRLPIWGVSMPAEGESPHRIISEDMAVLDPSLTFGGIDVHDQHSDMRMDVDNMSYEELLALEERIGNVSTGLTDDAIAKCLRTSKYSSLDVTVAMVSQESEVKCSICQEEYVENDELGRLDCDHSHHTACIKQWLLQKNKCPICKAVAYSKS